MCVNRPSAVRLNRWPLTERSLFVATRLTLVWHLVEYLCMDLQDKILSTVLDVQADVKEIKGRLEKVEDVQERTYGKLDGFMLLVN